MAHKRKTVTDLEQRVVERKKKSIKIGWLDEDGKTYIHYSLADIMVDTGCGKNKVLKFNMSYVEYVMECVRKNTTKQEFCDMMLE